MRSTRATALPTKPVAPESQTRRRPASAGPASVADAGATAGFGFGGAALVAGYFGFARADVAAFVGVGGTAVVPGFAEAGAAFGFAACLAAAGGFAGGLGAGLSRRVVMARASRAGLDPGPDQ